MSPERLEALLARLERVRAVAIGDVCLDVYWIADMRRATLSRETPHYNLPVVEERYSLGGAGNVMNNMRALGANVLPVTLLGRDWRGGIVRECMAACALPTDALVTAEERVTPAYVKPYRCGHGDVRYEDPRIDFENAEPPARAAEEPCSPRLQRLRKTRTWSSFPTSSPLASLPRACAGALCAMAAAGKEKVVSTAAITSRPLPAVSSSPMNWRQPAPPVSRPRP